MINMKRASLYKYLEILTGGRCYVGLHSINTVVTTVEKSEYRNYSKIEKAESILNVGLVNYYGETMRNTVIFFGDLNDEYSNKISALRIEKLNNYSDFSPDDQTICVIVAIPIFFQNANGAKISGGKIGYYYDDNRGEDRRHECLTDLIFQNHVPTEMILGYYVGTRTSEYNDYDIQLKINNKYFYNLNLDKQIDFFTKYFPAELNNLKSTSSINEHISCMKSCIKLSVIKNTINQYSNYILNDFFTNMDNDNQKKINDFIPYNTEELESTPIDEIDIERVIPNIHDMVYSKYNIKDLIISTPVEIEEGIYSLGLACSFDFDALKSDLNIMIDEYEKKILNDKQNTYQIYSWWYNKNYKIFNELYINRLKQLKNEFSNNIRI